MFVFTKDVSNDYWQPSPLAAGPFTGLQGGAVAGLLTAEIEALASDCGLGAAANASVWFLKPTPMVPLRTELKVLQKGGRVTIIDNTLYIAGEETPTATARVLLLKERAVGSSDLSWTPTLKVEPSRLPQIKRPAPHGGPWFMDAMDVHSNGDTTWFRVHTPVTENAGAMARFLGPADWAHGINRPRHNVLADPNPNLSVHLFRPPHGEWIGVQANTCWATETGCGHGRGVLWDEHGEIGSVAMSVALKPLR